VNCGASVRPGGIVIENATGTMANNRVQSACPHCRGDVRLVEGKIRARDDLFEVLVGPEWTRQTLRNTGLLFEEARRLAERDPAAALDLLEREAPLLAPRLQRWRNGLLSNRGAALAAWLSLAVSIIFWVLQQATDDPGVSESVLTDLVVQQLEQQSDRIEELESIVEQGNSQPSGTSTPDGSSFFKPSPEGP